MTDADRRFLEEMVPHHRDGMEMAHLALRRAEHDELREMAQRMIDDHLRETDQMREWHRAWYGTDAPRREPAWRGSCRRRRVSTRSTGPSSRP